MATKDNPGDYDCYAKLAQDEPYFLVRAKDALAPQLVRGWADARAAQVRAGIKPASDMQQVLEAMNCASEMERWRAAQ